MFPPVNGATALHVHFNVDEGVFLAGGEKLTPDQFKTIEPHLTTSSEAVSR